ncbi:MAG: hypothetical protein C4297_13620 [Gemmataceae bacterium]
MVSAGQEQSGNGRDLPPVTPPSAGLIVQLFIVPGLLVAVVVAVIWLFFGWLGGTPQSAEEYVRGLRSETRRWKTAETLAQVLTRDENLACDVSFALELCEVLADEWQRDVQLPAVAEEPDLSAEYLPAVLGRFYVPVGLPLLQEMISVAELRWQQKAWLLRLRGAVWALALLGEKMQAWPRLTQERREAILVRLDRESQAHHGTRRGQWAGQAASFLRKLPSAPSSGPLALQDLAESVYRVSETLARAAQAPDEMTRKYATLALSQWYGAAAEKSLVELCGANDSIRSFENDDEERGRREIRYNAVLVLTRHRSSRLPKDLLLEILDENKQRTYYRDNPGAADQTLLVALRTVADAGRPAAGEQLDPDVARAVAKLAGSDNPRLRIEAQRVLLLDSDAPAHQPGEAAAYWVVGFGALVIGLLAIAVFARKWKLQSATPGA